MSPERGAAARRLARLIAAEGPISVERYMAEANAHYYATRDPLGEAGDFVTAPEISQMFGELVGLWCADLWARAGSPVAHYVELGPGRGTLTADALRAMGKAGLEPEIHLVETSPILRAAQAGRLPGAHWHDGVSTLPGGAPLLVVANEFFDALPVQQWIGEEERMVNYVDGRFVPDPADSAAIVERPPASISILRNLAGRIAAQGGAALIVDYGHARSTPGETLQSVSNHAFADPWAEPGERDLTAFVDFEAVANAAREVGLGVFGPRPQGDWLEVMGIGVRAAALARAAPERADEIAAARERLVAPSQMGRLFKVMALTAPGWPEPAGFA